MRNLQKKSKDFSFIVTNWFVTFLRFRLLFVQSEINSRYVFHTTFSSLAAFASELVEILVSIFQVIPFKEDESKDILKNEEDSERKMEVNQDITEEPPAKKAKKKKNVNLEKLETRNVPFARVPKFKNEFRDVKIRLLKDTLNRFRLTGPESGLVLAKTLRLTCVDEENSDSGKSDKCDVRNGSQIDGDKSSVKKDDNVDSIDIKNPDFIDKIDTDVNADGTVDTQNDIKSDRSCEKKDVHNPPDSKNAESADKMDTDVIADGTVDTQSDIKPDSYTSDKTDDNDISRTNDTDDITDIGPSDENNDITDDITNGRTWWRTAFKSGSQLRKGFEAQKTFWTESGRMSPGQIPVPGLALGLTVRDPRSFLPKKKQSLEQPEESKLLCPTIFFFIPH